MKFIYLHWFDLKFTVQPLSKTCKFLNKISIFFFLFLIGACGGVPEPFSSPKEQKAVSLKIINYNLWHGLGNKGWFKREEIEPPSHREQRYKAQIKLFKEAKPDILFLQELNPVDSLSEKISKELKMPYIFQETNCGMSVLGLSLPSNLNMGLAILARPPLKIKKILGLKLSGPPGFCGDSSLTFQYGEFRYALFALAYHPQYGSFLLVNTHFHHGVEWSPKVRAKIESWRKSGVLSLSQKLELEKALSKSNLRREEELKNVFSQISQLKKHYGNIPLIFAGDLNSTAQSPIYKKIIENYKLKDSAGAYSPDPHTWDPEQNKKNHQYTKNFGVSVPVFDKKEVKKFFQENNQKPRRIDYIFVSPEIEILSHSLFAHQANEQGIIGSDHFGILVLIKTDGK